DADGHVLEPPTGMAERAPAKFRDRIWQIVTRPDGSEWLRYNGGERPANGLALAGVGGMSAADRERARRGEMKYTEVRAGAFRPLPRPGAGGRLPPPQPLRRRQEVQRPGLRPDLADLRGARPARRTASLPGARHAGRVPRARLLRAQG